MRRLIKSASALVGLAVALLIASCTADTVETPQTPDKEPPQIEAMVRDLYMNNPQASYEDVENYVFCFMDSGDYFKTKANVDYTPSPLALQIISEMEEVDPSETRSKLEYIAKLSCVVNRNLFRLSWREIYALNVTVLVSAEVIDMKYGTSSAQTRGIKSWVEKQWEDWGKCAAGIVGGAGKGALQGAAGAITGTNEPIPGAVVGGIAGGLEGAAEAC